MKKEYLENEEIKWGCRDYFVIREDKLIGINHRDWKEIDKGEKYCYIFQTPSTPPDFGLCLMVREDLKEVEGLGITDWGDIKLLEITNFDYINPKEIKSFILQDKEFKNWYDE